MTRKLTNIYNNLNTFIKKDCIEKQNFIPTETTGLPQTLYNIEDCPGYIYSIK